MALSVDIVDPSELSAVGVSSISDCVSDSEVGVRWKVSQRASSNRSSGNFVRHPPAVPNQKTTLFYIIDPTGPMCSKERSR